MGSRRAVGLAGAIVFCLVIGILVFNSYSPFSSDTHNHVSGIVPNKHYVFVIRDISNPITKEEIVEWRCEAIASLHVPPGTKLPWLDLAFNLTGNSAQSTSCCTLSHCSEDENKTNTKNSSIIAYGFAIWEENGRYVTSRYLGHVGARGTSANERSEEEIKGIYKKALAWYSSVYISQD